MSVLIAVSSVTSTMSDNSRNSINDGCRQVRGWMDKWMATQTDGLTKIFSNNHIKSLFLVKGYKA